MLKYSRVLSLLEAVIRNPALIYITENNINCFGTVLRTIYFCSDSLTNVSTKALSSYLEVIDHFTVLAWTLTSSEPFITCHHFDEPHKLNCIVCRLDALLTPSPNSARPVPLLNACLFWVLLLILSIDMAKDIMSDFHTILFFRLC